MPDVLALLHPWDCNSHGGVGTAQKEKTEAVLASSSTIRVKIVPNKRTCPRRNKTYASLQHSAGLPPPLDVELDGKLCGVVANGGGRGQRAPVGHLAAVNLFYDKYDFRVSTRRTWGADRIMDHHVILETCELKRVCSAGSHGPGGNGAGSNEAEVDEDSLFDQMD